MGIHSQKEKNKRKEEEDNDALGDCYTCPSTGRTSGACSGYVIDHVKPLKRGGADEPGNMQWQTVAAAKAKDRIE